MKSKDLVKVYGYAMVVSSPNSDSWKEGEYPFFNGHMGRIKKSESKYGDEFTVTLNKKDMINDKGKLVSSLMAGSVIFVHKNQLRKRK